MDFTLPPEIEDGICSETGLLRVEIERHLADGHRGERLRDGIVVAIIGPPNAGKSSLLNKLVRRDAAIISPIAGTTRDIVEVAIDLEGYPILLADTAGLRETHEEIERIAVRFVTDLLESEGWRVQSVEAENRGFDLIARKPHPEDPQTAIDVRFVEVKGRAGVGEVILSDNEYRTAVRLKKDYWLYAVFNCATQPQAHVVQGGAVANLLQGFTHTSSSTKSVKGHAIVLEKIPPRARGIDRHLAEFLGAEPGRRIAFHRGQQLLHPRRRPAVRIQRPTALARSIAGEDRFARRRKILAIPDERCLGWTRRPAENSGGTDAHEEDPVIRGVPPLDGLFHFLDRR